jgi:hypothetical protein
MQEPANAKMDENTMMLALHGLFEAWQAYKPYNKKENIYEELAEMLGFVAEEQGAFEAEEDGT